MRRLGIGLKRQRLARTQLPRAQAARLLVARVTAVYGIAPCKVNITTETVADKVGVDECFRPTPTGILTI